MKKLLLGTFFTVALVIAGTTNANAQAEKAPATKTVATGKTTVNKKVAPVSAAKVVPAKLKPIAKPSAAKITKPKAVLETKAKATNRGTGVPVKAINKVKEDKKN